MKDEILLELAAKWERDVAEKENQVGDASPEGEKIEAENKGRREEKRKCADVLRMLVQVIGEKQNEQPGAARRTGHRPPG